MNEERFELFINERGQADITDWVESKEKNAICIYNDLGVPPFSSAKAVCDLLNKLYLENNQLKNQIKIFELFLNCNNLDIEWDLFCTNEEECPFIDLGCQNCMFLGIKND